MTLWQLKDYFEVYYKQAPPLSPPSSILNRFLTYLTLQKVVQQVHATGPLVSLLWNSRKAFDST